MAKTLLNRKILSEMIVGELEAFEFCDRPYGIILLEVHGAERLNANWEIEGFVESHEGTWTPCYRQAVEIQTRPKAAQLEPDRVITWTNTTPAAGTSRGALPTWGPATQQQRLPGEHKSFPKGYRQRLLARSSVAPWPAQLPR